METGGAGKDITLTARLQRSDEHRPDALDASHVVTVWMDDSALIETVSTETERWLGFLPAELVGMSVTEFVHPEHVPQLQLLSSSLLEPRTIAGRVICRDGTIAPAEIIRYPRTSTDESLRMDVITWT